MTTPRETAEALLNAANETSGHFRTIWVTFLLFATYLAVAVGSTTHKDLLIGRGIELPGLGVSLELTVFFWAAPLIFLIYHSYTLLEHYVLSRKLHAFNIVADKLTKAEEEELRLSIYPDLVAQNLAGPTRAVIPRLAMTLTPWITLALTPIALMLTFQIVYLPAHDEGLTEWHRFFVLADLLLVWAFWPIILHPSGGWRGVTRPIGHVIAYGFLCIVKIARRALRWSWRCVTQSAPQSKPSAGETMPAAPKDHEEFGQRPPSVRERRAALAAIVMFFVSGIVSIMVMLFSTLVATVPDETIETEYVLKYAHRPKSTIYVSDMVWSDVFSIVKIEKPREGEDVEGRNEREALGLTAKLFDGKFDDSARKPRSPLTRNLVIVGESLARKDAALNLRDRNFNYARFDLSDLSNADFSYSKLNNASFYGSQIPGTDFHKAELTKAWFDHAYAPRAAFLDATLLYTRFNGTNLRGAYFAEAKFFNTSLNGTDLQGAALKGADLKNAKFYGTHLQAAGLSGAKLHDAKFVNAHLQGADLYQAIAPGASFDGSHFFSADTSSLIGAPGMIFNTMEFPAIDDVRGWIKDVGALKESDERKTALQRLSKLEAAIVEHTKKEEEKNKVARKR